MDYAEFLQLVYNMRQAQKDYFQYRNTASLDKSRILERKVDRAIKDYKDTQLDLFKEE